MKLPPVDYSRPGILSRVRSAAYLAERLEVAKFNAAQGIVASENADMFRIRARLMLQGKPRSAGGVWSVAAFVKGAIDGAISSGKDQRTFTVY